MSRARSYRLEIARTSSTLPMRPSCVVLGGRLAANSSDTNGVFHTCMWWTRVGSSFSAWNSTMRPSARRQRASARVGGSSWRWIML